MERHCRDAIAEYCALAKIGFGIKGARGRRNMQELEILAHFGGISDIANSCRSSEGGLEDHVAEFLWQGLEAVAQLIGAEVWSRHN